MMDLKDIRAIIFDFDGTLYDFSGLPKNLILNKPFDLFKIKADRDVRRELKGIDFGSVEEYSLEYFKRLSKHSGKSIKKITNWYYNTYLPHFRFVLKKCYKPFDKAQNLLSLLEQKGIKVAIYSDHSDLKGRAEALGLINIPNDFLFSAEEFGALKPAKRPFIEIAKKLNTDFGNILVVGDRLDTDGEGAFACGMNFIRIASKRSRKESIEEKQKNDKVFTTFEWNDFYNFLYDFYQKN